MKILMFFVGIALFAAAVIGSSATAPVRDAGQPDVVRAAGDALEAVNLVFAAVEQVAYAFDTVIHSGPPLLQALSGFLRCATTILALAGVAALASARRLARRL